jgi:aminomethyltransferase
VWLGTSRVLRRAGEDAERALAGLRRRRLDLGQALCARLFGPASLPGAEAALACSAASYLLAAAPGEPMSPGQQSPPTDLLLFVRRSAATRDTTAWRLPDPLADPRFEVHVEPASVEPYLVRTGEYIQVIDVRALSGYMRSVTASAGKRSHSGVSPLNPKLL